MAESLPTCTFDDARYCIEQAKTMIERGRFMWLKARESLEDAQKMRVSLHAQIEELANRGPFRPQFTATLLSEILDAVIEGTDADMGNIQIYDPQTRSLHIQVPRGFHEPFLEFFNSVDPGHAACGTALQSRERVIVPDVSDSTVFSGTHLWEVMLDGGVRAVQSTSFIGKLGHIWGMLSTHYRTVTQPAKKDLCLIDYLAAWAADILEAEYRAAHSHGNIVATDSNDYQTVAPAPLSSED
jgi:GAF domain